MEVRAIAAAVAWTVVIGLALTRTMTGVQWVSVWVLVVGQAAIALTGWVVFEHVVTSTKDEMLQELRHMDERTVERVARRLGEVVKQDAKVSSLR